VATPMAAYLEIIALNRLEFALETNRLRDPNQYGFTRNRGRHDLIARLISGLADHRTSVILKHSDKARAAHNLTTVIGLDVAGAFDNIGQDCVIKARKIISHGNEQPEKTQNLLNQIDNFIRSKGLEISAEKSELMHIIGPGRRPKPGDLPSYRIGGRPIDRKDYMKIPGIPIDRYMQLRIEARTHGTN